MAKEMPNMLGVPIQNVRTAAEHYFVMDCSSRKLPQELCIAIYNYDFEYGACIFENSWQQRVRTERGGTQ